MRNKLFKKYQYQLNKKIKDLNKNIANDTLWNGRFEFRQKESEFEIFPDGSGAILHALIRAYDKETTYYKDFWVDYAPWSSFNDWYIWKMANDFITKDTGVWEFENPRENKKDYTNIHISDKLMKMDYNFWISNNWRKNNER